MYRDCGPWQPGEITITQVDAVTDTSGAPRSFTVWAVSRNGQKVNLPQTLRDRDEIEITLAFVPTCMPTAGSEIRGRLRVWSTADNVHAPTYDVHLKGKAGWPPCTAGDEQCP